MKPQALQDAIKAAALKKRTNVEKGQWKEPVVKKHQMTAQEFQEAKSKKPQVPLSPTTVTASFGPSSAGVSNELLQSLQRERLEFQKEKQALLDEMRTLRKELTASQLSNAGKDASRQDPDPAVSNLQKEVSDLKDIVIQLQSTNQQLVELVQGLAKNGPTQAATPPTPPPVNGWPYIQPHSVEKMAKHQGRDEALKEFLASSKATMYSKKAMSVEKKDGINLVFFNDKIYIPQRLRAKTMKWYFDNYGKESASQKLEAHCTWPEQESDVKEFAQTL